ncbi:glycosyltransferase family 1 protein [Algoriphagus sp. A40]|uniref:glycosyltransferase family 4 protein n=1 Tax=Algoriphagus sp. A40 TaxID=1945863 RepID=UPI000985012A|nr:glycosyltransferase family 1 protein [Algoriphagus sp. A40]OOG68936.1 hypothetical protein B0E43_21910 [Algoriphagus sp. A40]
MRIAFDPQIFSIQKYGGISRYFVRIAEEMHQKGEQVSILAGYHINSYLNDCSPKLVKGKYLEKYPSRSIRAIRKLNSITGNLRSSLTRPDLIHETYFSSKPVVKSKAPVFVTVYDMIQEIYPDQFHAGELVTNQKKDALKRADHIFSISHHTKTDLCRLFDIPSEKISVVHLAADNPLELGSFTNSIEKPFLLYVGLRFDYKNFSKFLKAFSNSDSLKKEFNIIAFGGSGFSQKERSLIQSLGLQSNQVIHCGGSDLDLGRLYAKAYAFVYPSIYEGFGIPSLEAMSYGCPVLSSNSSSLPEVVGDAALTFNPMDGDEMTFQMEKVAFDLEIREQLIAKGYQRAGEFSWEKTARETMDVYRKFV